MTLPRGAQICLSQTSYYHCIARCVRRAFLCGRDRYSGRNFDHRRHWLVDRIKQQASIFGIDICAYAIMSNHYHLVLRVNRPRVEQWSEAEVLDRWSRLFRGPLLVQRLLAGEMLTPVERQAVSEIARVWRKRLYDISWFMRCLNEYIARRANAEDECKGRFWEGRFRSQALLDQSALLSCMAYVDLNPIRAGAARSLEESDFTSIKERLISESACSRGGLPKRTSEMLVPFRKDRQESQAQSSLDFSFRAYVALLKVTCASVCKAESQRRTASTGLVLTRLGLSVDQWLLLAIKVQQSSLQAVGSLEKLREFNRFSGRRWLVGTNLLRAAYRCA